MPDITHGWSSAVGASNLNDHTITTVTLPDQGSDPAAPAAGKHIVYAKAGGVYVEDSSATVVGPLGSGGSSTLSGASAIYAYSNFR